MKWINQLEENEVQSRLVGVVVVDDVAEDDLIQLGDIGHFSIGSLFLEQVGHRVVTEQQIIQSWSQNLSN